MTRTLSYRIVNVFTRGGPFTGNPLCVFESGEGLSDAEMQALARQFNLSETTFILPAALEGATARVRIFTPSYEMPFAGHPTLGTAHVVRALRGGDTLALEMKAGIIPVSARGDRWTLTANEPTARAVEITRADLEELLGLERGDGAEWPLWVNAGTEQLIMPLASAEAVRRARPSPDAWSRLASAEPAKVLVFHDAGDTAGTVEARFFFPSVGAVLEDPATGSACANLGGWFKVIRPQTDIRRVVSQGDAVQRPSTLHLEVEKGVIRVGGDVIELGRGSVAL